MRAACVLLHNLVAHVRPGSLGNLQEGIALLESFNRLSASSFAPTAQVYGRSTRLVQGITADLHYIFKNTRALQRRIQ